MTALAVILALVGIVLAVLQHRWWLRLLGGGTVGTGIAMVWWWTLNWWIRQPATQEAVEADAHVRRDWPRLLLQFTTMSDDNCPSPPAAGILGPREPGDGSWDT